MFNSRHRLPLNLLIVDDDPGVRSALRESARMHLERVTAAASLKEALMRSDSFLPDVVLTDFHLPDADGFASVPALRFRNATAVILGMSSESGHESIMLGCGAEGFLAKPFGITELVALIQKVMPTPSPEYDLPLRQAA